MGKTFNKRDSGKKVTVRLARKQKAAVRDFEFRQVSTLPKFDAKKIKG